MKSLVSFASQENINFDKNSKDNQNNQEKSFSFNHINSVENIQPENIK
jgi:hypothetical protein